MLQRWKEEDEDEDEDEGKWRRENGDLRSEGVGGRRKIERREIERGEAGKGWRENKMRREREIEIILFLRF